MLILYGTPVSAPLTAGFDDRNTFPTHLAKLGEGGFEVRDSLADINTISEERRVGKMCYSIAESKFYRFDSTWVEVPMSGSGLTEDQVKALFGATITPTKISFDREIYSPKLSTNPSTVDVGNISISGASNTLAVINKSNGKRALLLGISYESDGTVSLRSYDLEAESIHDRQMDSSEVQPSDPYSFTFTIPDDVIRTGLVVIPSEAGELFIDNEDTLGNLITDTEKITIPLSAVNTEVQIQFKNHVYFAQGDQNVFTIKGVRLKGKTINGQFIPYFKAKEFVVKSRPNVITENNIDTLHGETVRLINANGVITLPTDAFNLVVKYKNLTADINQHLQDLSNIRYGSRMWIENLSDYDIHLTPFTSGQSVEGGGGITLPSKSGIMLTADTRDLEWIYVSPYAVKELIKLWHLDGGTSADVGILDYDGGTSADVGARDIDGGTSLT